MPDNLFQDPDVEAEDETIEQWFPDWGKFPPGGKFEATKGEIITLLMCNKKISD